MRSAPHVDQRNAAFPPTSLQITEMRAAVGADNVVPGETHGPVQRALFHGPLPRPRALDGGFSFERTEVGEVYLYGAMPGEDWTYASDEIACCLQELPVYACGYGGHSGRAAIVHVDPTRFLARLPDRDRLIDEPEAIGAVCSAIKAVALAYTHRRRASPPRRSSGGSGHCGTGEPFRS